METNFENLHIKEFCLRYRISKSHFYKMRKKGLMPAITKIGARSIILNGDIQVWLKQVVDLQAQGVHQ